MWHRSKRAPLPTYTSFTESTSLRYANLLSQKRQSRYGTRILEARSGLDRKSRATLGLLVFLLFSSGLAPEVSPGGVLSVLNESVSQGAQAGGFLLLLFTLLDPLATGGHTQPAPQAGVEVLQQPVGSNSLPETSPSEVQSGSTTGSTVTYSTSSDTTTFRAIIPGIWDESSKKRSRSQVYVEILDVLRRGPMSPFEIAFYARLNHKRTKEYVRLLERSGYLESREEDGKTLWSLTPSGRIIMNKVRAILEDGLGSQAMPVAQRPLWTDERR